MEIKRFEPMYMLPDDEIELACDPNGGPDDNPLDEPYIDEPEEELEMDDEDEEDDESEDDLEYEDDEVDDDSDEFDDDDLMDDDEEEEPPVAPV